jgi:hypothetical protein
MGTGTYCYIYEVSLDTRQQWRALDSIVTLQCNQAVIEFYSNDKEPTQIRYSDNINNSFPPVFYYCCF